MADFAIFSIVLLEWKGVTLQTGVKVNSWQREYINPTTSVNYFAQCCLPIPRAWPEKKETADKQLYN